MRRGNTSSIPKGRLYGEYGGEAVLRNPEKRISLVQRRPSGERKAGKGMDKSQCLPKTSTLSSERGPVRKHSLTQDTKLGPTLQSRVAHQAPLSVAFSRQEYWSGLPFPSLGDLPSLEIKPTSLARQVDSLPLSHWGSPISINSPCY